MREQNPSEERLRELLVGRKVVDADEESETLTLDNGTVLKIGGNEGCGGCPSGWYQLTALNTCDNVINNVEVEENPTWEDDDQDYYRVHVFADTRHLLASFDGTDGNGYYGTGWCLSVEDS